MKGVLLCFALVLSVAYGHFFHARDITVPPATTCAPCTCDATTAPPSSDRYCPDCVNNYRCEQNAWDLAQQVPYPGDCTKFCKCDHNGAKEFDCPGGLHFNKVLQLCDWPTAAQCTTPGTYLDGCEHLAPNSFRF